MRYKALTAAETKQLMILKRATEKALSEKSYLKNSPVLQDEGATETLYVARDSRLKKIEGWLGPDELDTLDWILNLCIQRMKIKPSKSVLMRRMISMYKEMLLDMICTHADYEGQKELIDALADFERERENLLEVSHRAGR